MKINARNKPPLDLIDARLLNMAFSAIGMMGGNIALKNIHDLREVESKIRPNIFTKTNSLCASVMLSDTRP